MQFEAKGGEQSSSKVYTAATWNKSHRRPPLAQEMLQPESLKRFLSASELPLAALRTILSIGFGSAIRDLVALTGLPELNRPGLSYTGVENSSLAVEGARGFVDLLRKMPDSAINGGCEVEGVDLDQLPRLRSKCEFIADDTVDYLSNGKTFDVVIDWMCLHNINQFVMERYVELLKAACEQFLVVQVLSAEGNALQDLSKARKDQFCQADLIAFFSPEFALVSFEQYSGLQPELAPEDGIGAPRRAYVFKRIVHDRTKILNKMATRKSVAISMPARVEPEEFMDAKAAVEALIALYDCNTQFLRDGFDKVALREAADTTRFRAFYPEVRVSTTSHAQIDSRLSFGHVSGPGEYSASITRPALFEKYLEEQIGLLIRNHGGPVTVQQSTTPIPIQFAFLEGTHERSFVADPFVLPLRDLFDVPDLNATDDKIVNGEHKCDDFDSIMPLSPFTAQRVDYSLQRLSHYTATRPVHFQKYVLFTNYQFYVDEFCALARQLMADGGGGYDRFVEPGNLITDLGHDAPTSGVPVARLPQMPAYHLAKNDGCGITIVNIGVGPSNAKTITDHIAVLRPHAWLMLGHCAGLRNTQALGDYVLAHAYVREDHVLDEDIPVWVPIPALAEVQVALERAVAEVTGHEGYDLKRIMRTGTVATIDNRNWELRDWSGPVKRLSQSRAIALDMESATIAANGFRFRVPYGTLLCVSDKPLHGELKLPGMANEFYNRQVAQHLHIGIRALEKLAGMPPEELHSRKLRSLVEVAFQ